MFALICFSEDGDSAKEGEFDTIEDAWRRNNDMGSRWYFYPLRAVANDENIIVEADPLWLEGLTVAQAKQHLRHFGA